MFGSGNGKTGTPGPLLAFYLLVFCASCSPAGPRDAASLVAELDETIPAVVEAGHAPSIQIAVVYGDHIVWSRAFGESTGVDRVYMNGSVQKTFTAVAVLQLVDAGLIDLDADVNRYLPFPVRHPGYPETPITVRMLLAHRSGLDSFPHQFAWDTESAFAPRFRPPCPDTLSDLGPGGFLRASLTPEGPYYDPRIWVHEPGRKFHYSVSAYPLLRYLAGTVAGTGYTATMREHVFAPLGMTDTGFSTDEFAGRHVIPYTRIDGENIELPQWNGRGSLMHTTAADMAKFMLMLIHEGRGDVAQLLQPETVALMRRPTTRFKTLFKRSEDLPRSGQGLGHSSFRGGWYGIGGSVPGFQCLFRFNPQRKVGFVLMANVNAILGGGHNYASARGEVYSVQNALVSILDPGYALRRRGGEIAVVGALVLYAIVMGLWERRRRRNRRRPAA